MSRWAVWRCPQCGHEEQQLAVALAVGHRCKQVRQLVELHRAADEPSGAEPGTLVLPTT